MLARMSYATTGHRAVVSALGETPLDTLDQQLRLEEQAPPDPATLSPDDVVIAVKSACVGWVDLLMMSGQYQHVPEPPYTPGLEFAGEVVWRGERASEVDLGAAVIADGLLTGPRSLGAHRRWGGFASYAVAPANALIPLPTGFSFDEGACLLGGAETAYHALVHRAKLCAGEVVLVLGATGSTGLAAVALAKLLGATVIAAGRSAEKLEAARAQGADHAVLLGGEGAPRLRDEVKRLTKGRGAEVIFDPVGGPLSAEGLRAAAFGARFVVVGWAGTPFVARGGRDPNVLPTNLILMKSVDVLGSPAAISVLRDPSLRAPRLARILAWAGEGRLRPSIGPIFPFVELPHALRAKWEGRFAGNLIVRP
jgi:NADPH2:quinone reductase